MIALVSGMIFFGVSYAYLDYNLSKVADTDQKDYTVPYNRAPENCSVVFVYPDNTATLVYLDFAKENIRLVNISNYDPACPEYYGYSADYNVKISYDLIEGIIDRVGGIDITHNNEQFRYTGVQVIDLIAYGSVDDIKKQILTQIFNKISKNSFSKDDMVYIIENSEGNLSFIDCIDWLDYLENMSNRISFIN